MSDNPYSYLGNFTQFGGSGTLLPDSIIDPYASPSTVSNNTAQYLSYTGQPILTQYGPPNPLPGTTSVTTTPSSPMSLELQQLNQLGLGIGGSGNITTQNNAAAPPPPATSQNTLIPSITSWLSGVTSHVNDIVAVVIGIVLLLGALYLFGADTQIRSQVRAATS